jgi:hypothetical protein
MGKLQTEESGDDSVTLTALERFTGASLGASSKLSAHNARSGHIQKYALIVLN